ncbi:EF-hand domain-containing protein [Bizionia arctica]|uniref:EF-hand domain-containing protein n=1 Tax=Bizionia arctica TaxID=1495645 RepID=A0A917LV04_9FLAO|nr:EF-hand domain-containing protein [Bizionia arctica]GGG59097.1 hypothetical protein GCM10010976_32320 [Bizionia arctica]
MLDVNNDKLIDMDEVSKDERGKIAENFNEIDSNDDEYIDLEELEAFINEGKPKQISAKNLIKDIDDNGDGTLNELEIAAKGELELSNNFTVIDTNQDRELDIEELKGFFEENEEQPKRKKRDR